MFARFKGRPPRLYAKLLQKHARALITKAVLRRTDPEKYAAIQKNLDNIKHFFIRTKAQTTIAKQVRGRKARKLFRRINAQIIIAKQIRGRKERKAFVKAKLASNKIRVSVLLSNGIKSRCC
jgi:hypothetical protein